MNRCTTSKTCKLNLDSNMDLCDDILVLHNRDVGGGQGALINIYPYLVLLKGGF